MELLSIVAIQPMELTQVLLIYRRLVYCSQELRQRLA